MWANIVNVASGARARERMCRRVEVHGAFKPRDQRGKNPRNILSDEASRPPRGITSLRLCPSGWCVLGVWLWDTCGRLELVDECWTLK